MRRLQTIILISFTALLLACCSRHVSLKTTISKQDSTLQAQKEKESLEQTKKKNMHHGGWWGKVHYDGKPWVQNVSRPHRLSSALNGKHVSLWASHGRYFDRSINGWRWQRPYFFCTTEDLFTQTIVVPYLIPMLENAGAVVFTPRERDWQTDEVIVDNGNTGYTETSYPATSEWKYCNSSGFAMPSGSITDGFNPFEHGTARQIPATNSDNAGTASYQPTFSKSGQYAVYVSYVTLPHSIDDVLYSVYHEGQRTDFHVNQKMGGGTWVYLGTFRFGKGTDANNCVVVSAHSSSKGVVTTDAVRFGGGMGNVARDKTNAIANRRFLISLDTLRLSCDTIADSLHLALHDSIISIKRDSIKAIMSSAKPKVSGLPRCLEGARYYAQWAGAPDSVYSVYNSGDDYKDDINVRSLMTNWIAGGSPYVPDRHGKNVPIDLSLAIHSDAGYNRDMKSIYGSLAVCTTHFGDSLLAAGLPRTHSHDFAQMLLDQSREDLSATYGSWIWRDLYDRNYSETRLPAVPSAIFEMLSHQSFPDMAMAQDPNFKFTMARSIYKTILRYEANAHGEKAIVQPLAPFCLSTKLSKDSILTLSWKPQQDSQEATSAPTSYNIYTAMGNQGFDNGRNTQQCRYTLPLKADQLYRFRVTAVNDGGESFPTEELCVAWHSPKARNILVVNGFTRLSSPAVIDEPTRKGFDIKDDPGVSYGLTAGWSGEQKVFSTATAGHEGPGTFGYSGNSLSGHFIAGNDFNYTTEHVIAIASAKAYNVVSCSRAAVERGIVNLNDFDCVDLILGNEKDDGHSLMYYKTFTPELKQKLSAYKQSGHGALLVSGSYIASDMKATTDTFPAPTDSLALIKSKERSDSTYLADLLHCSFGGTLSASSCYITQNSEAVAITNTLNPDHYATTKSDMLQPLEGASIAMLYSNGQSAAVYYDKGFRTFAVGFPLECITSKAQQGYVMRSILQFLLK